SRKTGDQDSPDVWMFLAEPHKEVFTTFSLCQPDIDHCQADLRVAVDEPACFSDIGGMKRLMSEISDSPHQSLGDEVVVFKDQDLHRVQYTGHPPVRPASICRT